MRNLKKFLALALAVMMTFSLMVTVNAAPSTPTDFDDVNADATYAEAINVLSALGIIKGYEGTNDFKPQNPITRAEVAALIYRIAANDAEEKQSGIYADYNRFGDVVEGSWYAGVVNYCANAELVQGDGTNYAPRKNVTGYEILAMVLRMLGYDQNNEFTGSGWQIRTASYARQVGLTKNIKEGTLGQPATREVVCEILFQALQAPTVTYNMLTSYTPVKLVSQTRNASNEYVYDADVYNTLMYANYGIVGKRTILGSDNKYGRPVVEWVKDAKNDTVENGGKYIVNPQAATAITGTNSIVADGDKGIGAEKDAVYVPVSTPGATYGLMGGNAAYTYDKDKTDETVLAIPMTPVYTFNKAMTECELSKAINNDAKISWSDITEYVNGGEVVNRNDQNDDGTFRAAADNPALAYFDATHTTNTSANNKSGNTIGAAGRQTEIYNLGDIDNDREDEWIFVYIDVLLGEVVKVVPHTLDTNDHVVTQAELWIAVNDAIDSDIDADDAIVMKQDDNYTQKVGDLVTLTTWGMQDGVWNGTSNAFEKIGLQADESGAGYLINEAILKAVPNATTNTKGTVDTINNVWADFQVVGGTPKDKSWAVEFASKSVGEPATVPTSTITVTATVGADEDKTGVIAGGKTIPTTWAYHVDHDGIATNDTYHTNAGNVNVDSTLDKYTVNVTNQIIGQTYTVATDKNGNILGMWQDKSDKIIGVVTDVDYVRVGLGKYAVEMEVFTVDSKTETIRLLDASNRNNYFPTQEEADDAIVHNSDDKLHLGGSHNINPKGALAEFVSYTKDGETYWAVNDSCSGALLAGHAATNLDLTNDANSNATYAWGLQDSDGLVEPGKADTLRDASTHNTLEVNEDTVFIVAEYDFRYNTGNANQGSNIDVRYTVYESFRDIPKISGDAHPGYTTTLDQFDTSSGNNISFQTLDGKLSGNPKTEAKYVLISAFNPNAKYTMSKPDTFNPDNSFLVIAPVATYAEYSEYSVARNGELDTIKVANINGTVNADLQAAIRTKGLLVATSTNTQGYITAVDEVKDIDTQTNKNLGVPGTTPGTGGVIGDTLIAASRGLKHSKGVLSWDYDGTTAPYTYDTFLTVAEGCVVRIINVDNGQMYPATLDHIEQYQADHAIVFDVNSNGWVNCLYIID